MPALTVLAESDRTAIARELANAVAGEVRFGLHDRLLYATDASLYQVEPLGVVVPASVEDAARAFHRADELMEKYIEINTDKPEGHFLRGEVAFFQQHFAKALDHFKAAQDVAEDARSYLAYGESFTKADILAKAGLCLQSMDELEQARAMGRRVLKLNPEHKIGQALRAIKVDDDEP